MGKSGYKYTVSENERKRYHLVVSGDTHDTILFYARKWNVTITEATQRLLSKVIEEYQSRTTKL